MAQQEGTQRTRGNTSLVTPAALHLIQQRKKLIFLLHGNYESLSSNYQKAYYAVFERQSIQHPKVITNPTYVEPDPQYAGFETGQNVLLDYLLRAQQADTFQDARNTSPQIASPQQTPQLDAGAALLRRLNIQIAPTNPNHNR